MRAFSAPAAATACAGTIIGHGCVPVRQCLSILNKMVTTAMCPLSLMGLRCRRRPSGWQNLRRYLEECRRRREASRQPEFYFLRPFAFGKSSRRNETGWNKGKAPLIMNQSSKNGTIEIRAAPCRRIDYTGVLYEETKISVYTTNVRGDLGKCWDRGRAGGKKWIGQEQKRNRSSSGSLKAGMQQVLAQLLAALSTEVGGRNVKDSLAALLPLLVHAVGGARIRDDDGGGELRVGVELQAVFDDMCVLAVPAGFAAADDKAAVRMPLWFFCNSSSLMK